MPENLLSEANRRDANDPLQRFCERFYIPDGVLYFDGNSLGLLSHDAEQEVLRVLTEWKTLAVSGWTDAYPAWFFLAETLAEQVAPLVGAEPATVAVTNSTTVNLHQLLATLYRPDAKRQTILADALAFPSDIYAIESHLRLRGRNPETMLKMVPSRDGLTLDLADIEEAMTQDVQLAVLPSVIYTSGQLLKMATITAIARERGITLLWDLSHSIGVVPHTLDAIDADAAFWCHYKYLNAGPGAVGGLYLNRRLWESPVGLAGWFGSDKTRQFEMSHRFTGAVGAGALQIGTPPILALAPLLGSLRIHHEAGMVAIREKSLGLTDFLRRAATALLSEYGVTFALDDTVDHGGHVALLHPDAKSLSHALRQVGVVPDFRPPNILRLAPVPLYTSFADCLTAVEKIRALLASQAYLQTTETEVLVP